MVYVSLDAELKYKAQQAADEIRRRYGVDVHSGDDWSGIVVMSMDSARELAAYWDKELGCGLAHLGEWAVGELMKELLTAFAAASGLDLAELYEDRFQDAIALAKIRAHEVIESSRRHLA